MNPPNLKEPLPGVLREMSQKGNIEGFSDSGYDVNQIRYLKT